MLLAAEANARCSTCSHPFLQHEALGEGLGPESGLLDLSPRTELCPCAGGAELAGEEVDSKYPPEGPKAGQMLGKSQLMRKEAFNSPSFFF